MLAASRTCTFALMLDARADAGEITARVVRAWSVPPPPLATRDARHPQPLPTSVGQSVLRHVRPQDRSSIFSYATSHVASVGFPFGVHTSCVDCATDGLRDALVASHLARHSLPSTRVAQTLTSSHGTARRIRRALVARHHARHSLPGTRGTLRGSGSLPRTASAVRAASPVPRHVDSSIASSA